MPLSATRAERDATQTRTRARNLRPCVCVARHLCSRPRTLRLRGEDLTRRTRSTPCLLSCAPVRSRGSFLLIKGLRLTAWVRGANYCSLSFRRVYRFGSGIICRYLLRHKEEYMNPREWSRGQESNLHLMIKSLTRYRAPPLVIGSERLPARKP